MGAGWLGLASAGGEGCVASGGVLGSGACAAAGSSTGGALGVTAGRVDASSLAGGSTCRAVSDEEGACFAHDQAHAAHTASTIAALSTATMVLRDFFVGARLESVMADTAAGDSSTGGSEAAGLAAATVLGTVA